jgi:hypothetical protein
MADALIRYNGGTYRLGPEAVGELLQRRVIVANALARDEYELAPEHLFDEVEPYARPVVHQEGDAARGEDPETRRRAMLAWRFSHRDGQGGAH